MVTETAVDWERIVLVVIRDRAACVGVADAVSSALFESFDAVEQQSWSEAMAGKEVAGFRS